MQVAASDPQTGDSTHSDGTEPLKFRNALCSSPALSAELLNVVCPHRVIFNYFGCFMCSLDTLFPRSHNVRSILNGNM